MNSQNDVLSFHKEQLQGCVEHNIVQIFRQDGLSQQQAYGQVSLLMQNRFRDWYIALSEIPVCGEEIDEQVMLYVKGCQDIIRGNLNWGYVLVPSPCRSFSLTLFTHSFISISLTLKLIPLSPSCGAKSRKSTRRSEDSTKKGTD